ncbi:Neuropeptide S receptor [Homalodisca vitripennis]|nr:Neuropeptide S receptor [Homalodisca vitripennis]
MNLLVGVLSVLTDIVWRSTVAWNAGNVACKVIRFSQAELAAVLKEIKELLAQRATLKNDVEELKDRLITLEQYLWMKNIEVGSVPFTPREHIITLVKDVGAALGMVWFKDQLDAEHGPSSKPAPPRCSSSSLAELPGTPGSPSIERIGVSPSKKSTKPYQTTRSS